MKTFVFLLLLANLLLYAFGAGHLGQPDNPDAARLSQQVAPERLRVISRGEAPPLKAAEAAPASVPPACLRWTGLGRDTGEKLEKLLRERHPAYQLERETSPGETRGWWVYLPPLANKAEADRKAAELRQLGVTDYFILPEANPNRNGISLGIFSSERSAQERLNELRAKGVRTARLAPRSTGEATLSLTARGPLPERDALLAGVAEELPRLSPETCK